LIAVRISYHTFCLSARNGLMRYIRV
jgi:hypothetical protein